MKHILAICLLLFSAPLFCQSIGDYQSHQTGNWNVTSTWERWNGTTWITPAPSVPSSAAGVITIQTPHGITVTATTTVDQVTIDSGGVVIISAGRTLTIGGAGINLTVGGMLSVGGTLTSIAGTTVVVSGGTIIRQQGGNINSSFLSLTFQAGAVFEHQLNSASTSLSAATYDPESTLLINGFTGTGTFSSPNWTVPLGNVIYDCANQAAGTVNFAGLLRNVRGNFEIRNTGSTGRIYFNATDTSTQARGNPIMVAGSLLVTGLSRVFLSSTGSVELYVAGDFSFNPDSNSGPSQFATSGSGILRVGGNASLTSGTWDLISGSSGAGNFDLNSNFLTTGSTITKSGGSKSHGSINFNGLSRQLFDPTGVDPSMIDVTVNNASGVYLSNDLILGGSLTLSTGTMILSDIALTLNGIISQDSGLIASDVNSSPSLIIGGSGALPSDLAIAEGSVFSKLELNRPGDTLLVSSGFAIEDNLAVTSGTLLSKGSILFRKTSILSGAGLKMFNNIVIEQGDSLTGAVNLTVNGNLINNGTIRLTAGTVTLDGNATTLAGTGSSLFSSVAISPLANVTADLEMDIQGAITIGGNLIINDGVGVLGSLTVSPNGSVSVNSCPLSVAGIMTVSSGGNFTGNTGADVTLKGNLSVNGVFTSLATTSFTGNSTMTGTGAKSFDDVRLSGVLTPNAAYTITGDLTLSGEGLLNPGNNTTTFAGSQSVFLNSGNGSATFFRVTINAGDTLNTQSFFTVNSTFTARGVFLSNAGFAAIGIFRVSPTTGFFIANNAPFSIGGTLTVSSKASFIANSGADGTIGGNVSVTGSVNAISTISFSGTTILSGSGVKTFSRMIIRGALTPNANYNIAADLEVSGVLNPGNATTTFTGTTTISGEGNISFNNLLINTSATLTSLPGNITIVGNITNDGNFKHNGGSVTFSGNSAKVISTSLITPLAMEFNDILLEGGAGDVDLRSEMDINLYGILSLRTATANATFDVDGSSDNKIFTLRSIGDNPTLDASIAALTSGALVAGKITVQRYASGEGRIYRYISCPVSGATVADWQSSFFVTGKFDDPSNPGEVCGNLVQPLKPSLFYYDESLKNYIAFPASGPANSNPLIVGRGYAAFIRQCIDPTVISVKGTLVDGLNRGSVGLPVTHTPDVSDYNNLLGNPFPSAISWDSARLAGVSATIAIRDNGNGVFLYYTQGGVGAHDVPNGVIAQGQAFWTRTTGSSPSVTVTENAKVPSSNSTGGIFFKRKVPDLLEITLSGSTQVQFDKAYLLQSEGSSGSDDLDSLDAPKMNNQLDDPFTELFDLYTTVGRRGRPLALNALPAITCNTRVQLSVRDGKEGSYSFNFMRSGELVNLNLFLFDRFMGHTTLLNEPGQYFFNITEDTASQSVHRFELIFTDQQIEVDLPVDASLHVCSSDSAWVKITNPQSGMRYGIAIQDRLVADSLSGFDSIRFQISPRLLAEGENKISVIVNGGCGSLILNHDASIWKNGLYTASASSEPHCLPGSVRINASGAPPGGVYHWYTGRADSVILFSGSTYVTPDLQKSRAFYVAAIDSLGLCEGERVKTNAIIINYDSARIILHGEDTLMSNYLTGNQWYLNGDLLSDTTSVLQIQNSGLYGLKVSIGNCLTTDERALTVTGIVDDHALRAYPNPVTTLFYLEMPIRNNGPEEIAVFNSFGILMGLIKMHKVAKSLKGLFDFSSYSPGLYFIQIDSNGIDYLKIFKK